MPISLEVMPLEPKPAEPTPPKTMVVRYGYMKLIGEFQNEIKTKVGCGTRVVVRSPRGTELAEMLTTVCGNGGCNKSITRDKMLEYIANSGGADYPFSEGGRVLRMATAQDLTEQHKLDEHKKEDLKLAREMVQRHQLPMKIVEVEYLLGGERVIFYFYSEHRVDFRSLVRDLAHSLHTRIELRQVGARDEARLVADYEKCGQHCCCKQFLKVLTPISMRSAKIQKATLDPAKISGRCGRLMCCLRYEDQTYEDLRKKLPKKHTRVRTAQGEGWVIDGQILTQLVLVQYDDSTQTAIPIENIEAFDLPKPVLPGGRTMQFPGDRPPEQQAGQGQNNPRDRRGGPANRPQQQPPRFPERQGQQSRPNAGTEGPPSAPPDNFSPPQSAGDDVKPTEQPDEPDEPDLDSA
ncbi:MAG TPA: regulatory iron-sulfur-containing complex subunit RicT [Phycisphaerae bacterium]|nr:regulatory iron-sulfur-containing complex subunit RicT [Phycisphaerae bacterium]